METALLQHNHMSRVTVIVEQLYNLHTWEQHHDNFVLYMFIPISHGGT